MEIKIGCYYHYAGDPYSLARVINTSKRKVTFRYENPPEGVCATRTVFYSEFRADFVPAREDIFGSLKD